jgi:hypothetical protein
MLEDSPPTLEENPPALEDDHLTLEENPPTLKAAVRYGNIYVETAISVSFERKVLWKRLYKLSGIILR